MSKASSRGLARREIIRAKGNLAVFAEHHQKVILTHYEKGYPEIDMLLDAVREGTIGLDTLCDLLLERI